MIIIVYSYLINYINFGTYSIWLDFHIKLLRKLEIRLDYI